MLLGMLEERILNKYNLKKEVFYSNLDVGYIKEFKKRNEIIYNFLKLVSKTDCLYIMFMQNNISIFKIDKISDLETLINIINLKDKNLEFSVNSTVSVISFCEEYSEFEIKFGKINSFYYDTLEDMECLEILYLRFNIIEKTYSRISIYNFKDLEKIKFMFFENLKNPKIFYLVDIRRNLTLNDINFMLKYCGLLKRNFATFFLKYYEKLCKKEKRYLLKDLNKEMKKYTFNKINIDFNDVISFTNKKELLQNKFKNKKIYNTFNKIPLVHSYFFIKNYNNIYENEHNEILKEIINKPKNFTRDISSGSSVENIKQLFLRSILFSKLNNNRIKFEIKDYVRMCFKLKEKVKINFKIDFTETKQFLKEHDRIAEKYSREQIKKEKEIKIKRNNPFLKIKFPSEIKMIKTVDELYEEGILNRNCVFSYLDKIKKEKCGIFTYTDNDNKRYTIEIHYNVDTKRYSLVQIKGKFNVEAPLEVIQYVESFLNK